MDNENLSFFQKIYFSITSVKKYKYFLGQKTAKAVIYLLLLSLMVSIAVHILPIYRFYSVIDVVISRYDENVPEFSFKNGQLDVMSDAPVIVNSVVGPYSAIIIDTSGQTDENFLTQYDSAVLLLKDRLIIKDYEKKQYIDYSMTPRISADKASVKSMLPALKWLAIPVALISILFYVGTKFFHVLFISILGVIINWLLKTRLRYRDVLVLSIYSATLAILLSGLLEFIPFLLVYLWSAIHAISIFYLFGAIADIKRNTFYDDSSNNSGYLQ